MREHSIAFALAALLCGTVVHAGDTLAERYVEGYFATFPTRATAAGRHDLDHALEDLSKAARQGWVELNRDLLPAVRARLAAPIVEADRLDLELLERQLELELLRWETLRMPERNPLFWSGIVADATVFLLVREDRPASERFAAAAARVEQLPRLARQARATLGETDLTLISPRLAAMAAGQTRAAASFYRIGLPRAAAPHGDGLERRSRVAGEKAAAALETLAALFDELAQRASGSARTGAAYEELFRLYTGIDEPVSVVLARAERDLKAKRAEAAAFGRSVWRELMETAEAPPEDTELLRALFRRLEADTATSVDELVDDYRRLSEDSIRFVRERELVTIPEPLGLWIGPSPDYFAGQSVGGVYPAGPFAPSADTLLFLPSPPSDATVDQQQRLWRAFNDHFNAMITPHELVPGHTLQLVSAARHPRTIRALFPDDVYVEGWGTFCERLMLDLGWGGSAERLAHLKKQLENIARTIADIRVHTTATDEEEILRFVRDEALQDEQLAANMWARAITSSPQLTTYYLGSLQVTALYDDVRAARGETFRLQQFMDAMMDLGPVPVAEYRALLLGSR